jgi:hypothetical protein
MQELRSSRVGLSFFIFNKIKNQNNIFYKTQELRSRVSFLILLKIKKATHLKPKFYFLQKARTPLFPFVKFVNKWERKRNYKKS